ncbi:unnamed protein product [Parnassius apollo]|uniref:(apollo) hypothetical protein n=1 Tax=Parnassius apollo TaxID=110799 RepID=A0A8S3X6F3_PARAO|nr:unnamed protein product [Parnassius apollo]
MPSCVLKTCKNASTSKKKDVGVTYHRGAFSSRSNDFIATVDTKASDTKKRQKTTVSSEIAKKIKQESLKKLTLKDFDIEDIDDIIELD